MWRTIKFSHCKSVDGQHPRVKLPNNKFLFENAPTHLNQQLATLFERFCAKLFSNCEEFDPEFFSCITSLHLLGWHMKISGTLCILLVVFVEICFRRKNALWSVESSFQVQFS